MPPASKRKRGGGGGAGPKTKKGKKKSTKKSSFNSAYSSASEEEVPIVETDGASDVDDGKDEWVVEEVVDKRVRHGKTEYFLKWKNWPSSTNTWEPMEHLENCPELVEKFEAKVRRKEMMKTPSGFDNGLVARAVRGVYQLEGGNREDLSYLVEWEDHDRWEKIPAAIVREKIPQEVIKFLAGKIKWTRAKPAKEDQLENNRSSPDKMSTEGSPEKDEDRNDKDHSDNEDDD